MFHSPVIEVPEWTLAGPFPNELAVTAHPPTNVPEKILEDAIARRAGLAASSEAMHCAAREVGRFILAKGGVPDSGLLDFIGARCSTPGATLRPGYLVERVAATASDGAIFERWHSGIEGLIQQSLQGGPVVAGLWFGRQEDRAVVVIVSGVRKAAFEPFSTLAPDDVVAFQGEVLEGPAQVQALVNRGTFGFAPCEPDASMQLPRFAFKCSLAPGDRVAMIEVSAQPLGRILSQDILRVLARRPDVPANVYQRAGAAPGAATDAEQNLPKAVQTAVNEVRKRAELQPLLLSETQSETATTLAPHYFAASLGLEPPTIGDLVALGLAAGYRVGGAIKDFGITAGWTPGSRSVGLWLDSVLRYPNGRAALLSPNASVLAVGAVTSAEPPLLAAIATTYELFGKEDFAADTKRLEERIAKARKDGATPPAALPEDTRNMLAELVRELPSGRLTSTAALEQALQRASESLHRPVRGWVLYGTQIDALPLPDELLAMDATEMALALSYEQAPDEPWGRYVAIVIVADPDVST